MIGVTGASGGLGGRVARLLSEAGTPQRLVLRDPARAPELPGAEVAQASFGDGPALLNALDGVDTLLLVSASESADRVPLHTATVEATAAAGVRRIVYVSFLNAALDATFTYARDHWLTERIIRTTGMDFTFLRDSLYLDMIPVMVGEDDVIRGPAGDGRVGAVSRADVAEVALRVLLDESHNGRTYELTGPEAFTLDEAAKQLTAAWGRPISYQAETLDEAYRSRQRFDAAPWEVAGWVTSYAAIAGGELDLVTDAVESITGHPPTSLSAYLQDGSTE